MSRHGPSGLGLDLLHDERPNIDRAAVLRPSLSGICGLVTRIGDGHLHGPPRRPAANPLGYLLLEEVGASLRELVRRHRERLRRRQERPAHRVLRAGIVGEDKGVEAVEPLFRVAACPGRALRPLAELRDLRIGFREGRHRVRVFAARCDQKLVERLRRRDREERRVDHGHAPLLPVRSRNAEPDPAHPDCRIRRVRIGRAQIEAS